MGLLGPPAVKRQLVRVGRLRPSFLLLLAPQEVSDVEAGAPQLGEGALGGDLTLEDKTGNNQCLITCNR